MPVARESTRTREPILYPAAELASDSRGSYYEQLLKLALAKADGGLEAQPTQYASGISRALVRLAQGDGVDVMWAPPTEQLDRDFLRVRVPLDRGILGWRLFLIRQQDSEDFISIGSLAQLKTRLAGQVAEWLDTDILLRNGLPVVKAARYQDLFNMLANGRFSYLPRGIGEIQAEAQNYAKLGLQIESHLALYYPMCAYFFVERHNTRLAEQLEIGLRRAIDDGSFERLFQQYNGASLEAARLSQRAVLRLNNPFSPTGPGSGYDDCAQAAGSIRAAN